MNIQIKTIAYGATLFAISLVVGFSVTTQRLAASFNYSPELGNPLFDQYYSPSNAISWSVNARESFAPLVKSAWLSGTSSFATVLVLGGLAYVAMTYTRRPNLDGHGTARWSKREDVVDAGLLDVDTSDNSIIVGGWKETNKTISYLTHTGPESCLLFAPPRSGKGVSLVIPILLTYEKSSVVLDVKGELWDQTAGYRKNTLGQKVLFHDPSNHQTGSACFNPLDEIRYDEREAIKDAQLIAEYVIDGLDADGKASINKHFVESAQAAFVGVVLHEHFTRLDESKPVTIASVLSALSGSEIVPRQYFELMEIFEDDDCQHAQAIREYGCDMTGLEDKEFTAVVSSLKTPLKKFRDPILAEATSRSDFKIMQLVESPTPVTLYIIIRPSDKDRLKNYFALLVNILFRKMTERLPDSNYKRKELLMMLDEFSKLPPLPVVQDSMDVMPGYGIKAFIVIQDFEKLIQLYGESETISSGCKIVMAYTPAKSKTGKTAKLLSEMVGTTTIQEKTLSKQKKIMAVDGKTESEGLHQRALITPDEITRLKVPKVVNNKLVEAGETLVFTSGAFAIKGVQTPWFFDDELSERGKIKPPVTSDVLNG